MPGLKSATYKRVITITAIIIATIDRNYCLHEAVNVQKHQENPILSSVLQEVKR